jgi:iron complex outermembrane recepter protein
VNFVLQRNFTEPETRVRYGAVSNGSSRELQVGQTGGTNWNGGSALLSYEYYDRTPLDGRERGMPTPAANFILPDQERHGALLTVNHTTDSALELFIDSTYSKRQVKQEYSGVDIPSEAHQSEIDASTVSIGARQQFERGMGLEVSSSYARSRTHSSGFYVDFDLESLDRRMDTDVVSADVKLDGSLLSLPAGEAQFAIGGQFRREGYTRTNLLAPTTGFKTDRDVSAGFVELRIPVIAGHQENAPRSVLDITLADRYERYSDFGSTNNPKVGVIWRPTNSLSIRSTYGTSFKAPLLSQLDTRLEAVIAANVPAPNFETADVLTLIGGNAELASEDATSWTAGFDFHPESISRLHISATYYNIRYKDRIVAPGQSIDSSEALGVADVLGPQIVQQDPSSAIVEGLATDPSFVDFRCFGGTNCGRLDTVVAILDYRLHNLSDVRTSGIDLGIGYSTDVGGGVWETGIDGTYILDFDNRFTPRSVVNDTLNTPYNPVDLKLRARTLLTHGDWNFAMFVNYVDSYTDRRVFVPGTPYPISSWTTVDTTIGYTFGPNRGPLSGLSATLGVLNLTDEDPPLVRNRFYGTDFDGANANALGRFLSMQIAMRW